MDSVLYLITWKTRIEKSGIPSLFLKKNSLLPEKFYDNHTMHTYAALGSLPAAKNCQSNIQ